MTTTDWIGFIGVTILLVAFFLNITDKIKKDSLVYLSMNFVGAGIACLASVLLKYIPFIILEGSWTLVSAYGLIKYFKK
jgi:nicotinamide riboside transporter PnuC